MALQDLTPQLRTRLGKVERTVGVFVTVSTLLLAAGFAYYIRHTAKKKGWFDAKVEYCTGINNAAGLVEGVSKVRLMGKDVGEITKIVPNDPGDSIGWTVYFNVRQSDFPYFGYIWTDSKVKVVSGDLLGGRVLEVTKGSEYWAIATAMQKTGDGLLVLDQKLLQAEYTTITNQLFLNEGTAPRPSRGPDGVLRLQPWPDAHRAGVLSQKGLYDLQEAVKTNASKFYARQKPKSAFWIDAQESRPIGERLEQIGDTVEAALPSFLVLTNQIRVILDNAVSPTERLDAMLAEVRPAVSRLTVSSTDLANILAHTAAITQRLTNGQGALGELLFTPDVARIMANAAVISGNLTNGQGSLGEWLITTNINGQLERTFGSANVVLGSANTNLLTLNRSLEGLAGITSNLNAQVRANSNMLSSITQIVTNSDNFILGLQRHWLLRSAFKPLPTTAPSKSTAPRRNPLQTRP